MTESDDLTYMTSRFEVGTFGQYIFRLAEIFIAALLGIIARCAVQECMMTFDTRYGAHGEVSITWVAMHK